MEVSQALPGQPAGAAASQKIIDDAVYRKVTWRIIPFLMLCYIVAYLDRVNVGFAKLQMLADLQFSETVYGLGAGVFFLGYFLFEVPSNVMLHKIGARVWIARIMITWAIISGAFMFVTTPTQFYIMRFLLGIAEAGFFPGIILYLTYWYPSERRARMVCTFMAAIPVAGLIGGPLSGWIMETFAGWHGYAGWQWMFVLEAIPAALMGVAVLLYLDNSIRAAKWLTEDEKVILEQRIATEAQGKVSHPSIRAMFADPRIWLMALIYFCCVMGQYSLTFWLPSLIKAAGVTGVAQYRPVHGNSVLGGRGVDDTAGPQLGQIPRTPLAHGHPAGGRRRRHRLQRAGRRPQHGLGHLFPDHRRWRHPRSLAHVLELADGFPRRRLGRRRHRRHQFGGQPGRLRGAVHDRFHQGYDAVDRHRHLPAGRHPGVGRLHHHAGAGQAGEQINKGSK